MSTKIWTAWAIKPRLDAYDVCMQLRREGARRVRAALSKIYDGIVAKPDDWLNDSEEKSFGIPKDFTEASNLVYKLYRQQRGSPNRNRWDLDVSFSVRRADTGRWLIIPYPGSGMLSGMLSFMKNHKALVDYHYQNQTDMPDDVTARAWNERARTWEPLLSDDRWQDYFSVEVMSIGGFFNVCPSTERMKKAFIAANKKSGKVKP